MSQLRSWDFERFWRTLLFFQTIPIIHWIQRMLYGSVPPLPPSIQSGLIIDFAQPNLDLNNAWGAVDDVVMGGVSASKLSLEEGKAAVFTGVVSTNNNGGFASVRTRNFEPPLNLSDYAGLVLRVKGDGQRYKFFLRDDNSWDGIAYAHSFDTVKNQWIDVRIPFRKLVPVRRAKTLGQGANLDPSKIRAFQFMLSKFEYDGNLNPQFVAGPFCLEISTISTISRI